MILKTEPETSGFFSYRNWKANLLGKPWQQIFEYPLFSDARFIGEITEGLGPYQIINTVASRGPALVLRIQQHLEYEVPAMDTTQDEHYHGGSESDELAALLSLCLGVRIKAGGATRVFGRDGDPMGRPIGWWGSKDPDLSIMQINKNPSFNSNSEHYLEEAKIISSFPLLLIKDTVALVRAARMYQEAIWMSEATPELSWIMLTSAIETVAQQWRTTAPLPPIEKMRAAWPNLEKVLRSYAGDKADELALKVAKEITAKMGSTKNFRDFILTFMPPPPSIRPPVFAQASWGKPAMKRAMNQIYEYRSRALHGSHPFPAPMCEPPKKIGENGELEEIPFALATSMKGGVWVAKDTPMLLHTFNYIVRHCILNWWKSVASEGKKETE